MSQLLVDDIVNKDDTGSPGFSRGAVVTGVCTATSFSGSGANLTGISAGLTTDAYRNTSGGLNAGDSFTSGSATDNTLIGYDAGTAITTGDTNVAVGSYALDGVTTGIEIV